MVSRSTIKLDNTMKNINRREFLKKTGEKKDAAALSFLMELSHGQRPAQKKKKYSFD